MLCYRQPFGLRLCLYWTKKLEDLGSVVSISRPQMLKTSETGIAVPGGWPQVDKSRCGYNTSLIFQPYRPSCSCSHKSESRKRKVQEQNWVDADIGLQLFSQINSHDNSQVFFRRRILEISH